MRTQAGEAFDAVLAINAGSSSVKFALFNAPASAKPQAVMRGFVSGIGHAATLRASDARGTLLLDATLERVSTQEEAYAELLRCLNAAFPRARLIAAAHRVVHGGEQFVAPVRITPEIRSALERLAPLAPLHQLHNLAAIDLLARLHPDMPQIACFDTAFHAGQSWENTAFALPIELSAQGIRRYGFHGLSYQFIASALSDYLGERAEGRVVVAHLGSGSSMCALSQRRSIATTMGFTALDGLPMGTRSGTLDPGVLLYLLQQGWSEQRLSNMLWRHSGLLGISGISEDMRTLLASPDPRAAQAVSLFTYRIARELGSLAIALGGLDALVFTAGIGERAPFIRARICELASSLGISLNAEANERNAARISSAASAVSVCVIPTDEEAMVAQGAFECLR